MSKTAGGTVMRLGNCFGRREWQGREEKYAGEEGGWWGGGGGVAGRGGANKSDGN